MIQFRKRSNRFATKHTLEFWALNRIAYVKHALETAMYAFTFAVFSLRMN